MLVFVSPIEPLSLIYIAILTKVKADCNGAYLRNNSFSLCLEFKHWIQNFLTNGVWDNWWKTLLHYEHWLDYYTGQSRQFWSETGIGFDRWLSTQ